MSTNNQREVNKVIKLTQKHRNDYKKQHYEKNKEKTNINYWQLKAQKNKRDSRAAY